MPHYEGMKFADFQQQDWPKLAYPDGTERGKRTVLCHTQAEYDAVMGKKAPTAASTGAGGETAKEKAVREAAELGVEIKGNWGADRINQAIAEFVAKSGGGSDSDDGSGETNLDDEN